MRGNYPRRPIAKLRTEAPAPLCPPSIRPLPAVLQSHGWVYTALGTTGQAHTLDHDSTSPSTPATPASLRSPPPHPPTSGYVSVSPPGYCFTVPQLHLFRTQHPRLLPDSCSLHPVSLTETIAPKYPYNCLEMPSNCQLMHTYWALLCIAGPQGALSG